MMKRTMILVLGALFLTGATARADGPSVDNLPPSVIQTVPQGGDLHVDAAATTQIRVTFSKEMEANSYSWVQVSAETFPQIIGKPRFLAGQRTCVIDVHLQPKTTYVIWLNSEKYRNFRDTGGRPAVPYLLVFQTQ
jgi:Bacterial Ig-like domain